MRFRIVAVVVLGMILVLQSGVVGMVGADSSTLICHFEPTTGRIEARHVQADQVQARLGLGDTIATSDVCAQPTPTPVSGSYGQQYQQQVQMQQQQKPQVPWGSACIADVSGLTPLFVGDVAAHEESTGDPVWVVLGDTSGTIVLGKACKGNSSL